MDDCKESKIQNQRRSNHMSNQINTKDGTNVLFLTDQYGDSYIVSKETVEHASVPEELKTELHELVTADTKGYGNADWMLGGIVKFWGLSCEHTGWTENNVGNF